MEGWAELKTEKGYMKRVEGEEKKGREESEGGHDFIPGEARPQRVTTPMWKSGLPSDQPYTRDVQLDLDMNTVHTQTCDGKIDCCFSVAALTNTVS